VSVAGVEEARAVTGVRGLKLRARPGDYVPRREGSGQDVGWIDAEGESRDAVARALEDAHARLRLELRPAR
jgi:L-amino acid ligase C-terminal domain 2